MIFYLSVPLSLSLVLSSGSPPGSLHVRLIHREAEWRLRKERKETSRCGETAPHCRTDLCRPHAVAGLNQPSDPDCCSQQVCLPVLSKPLISIRSKILKLSFNVSSAQSISAELGKREKFLISYFCFVYKVKYFIYLFIFGVYDTCLLRTQW